MHYQSMLILATLLLIAATGAVSAQTSAQEGERPAAAETEQQQAETAEADSDGLADDNEESDTAGQTGRSPYEYRPSEQISEDRSVSFPVDI